jgi:CRISPR-associated protein Cmr4
MMRRTLEMAGFNWLPDAPATLEEQEAHHADHTVLTEGKSIYLEDLDFVACSCDVASQWAEWIAEKVFASDSAWQREFKSRFVVLPDSAFDFLCETGTEVHTRVRINDETKTVDDKALWTEESLPAETILMGLVQCDRIFGSGGKDGQDITPPGLLDGFAKKSLFLQIGGKATIGRGQVRCVFTRITGGER